MRPFGGLPQPHAPPGALLALLEEGEVVEPEATYLEVHLPGPRLRRDQLRVGHRQHHLVDVGKLPAGAVYTMEEGVAAEHIALGRAWGDVAPRLKGRRLRVEVPVGRVLAVVDRGPASPTLFARLTIEPVPVRVAGMEPAKPVRRGVDVDGAGAREGGQEERIRRIPRVAHGRLVQHLEPRRPPACKQLARRAGRRELLVVRDVLPVVPEVLRSKGMAVRPAMPGPEMQGEHPLVRHLHPLQDVGDELETLVVADEPGVAIHHHQAHILGPARQHPETSSVAAGLAPHCFEPGDERAARKPFRDRSKLRGRHLLRERGRLDVGGRRRRAVGEGSRGGDRRQPG